MAIAQTSTRNSITLTDEAVQMLKLFAHNAQKGHWGIKFADEVSICGEGYNYIIDLVSAPEEHDVVFHCKGIDIYVPEQSLKRLAGSEIEYHEHHDAPKDSFKKNFHVNNPNAKSLCPCGCGDGAGY